MGTRGSEAGREVRVGDLITISRAPAVVSLGEVEGLREELAAGRVPEGGRDLLGEYSLDDPDTRAAFEAMVRSLGRAEARGDAFIVQGVYGSGKSHLLAVLTLLCGHAEVAWPVFLVSHPEHQRAAAGFTRPRLVVAIALDGYPTQNHPLEHIVFSRIEQELARRHGVRVALGEESHLLDLVERYVAPQVGDELEAAARGEAGMSWAPLRAQSPARAAEVAAGFLQRSGFPLDWRRSRAEAWGVLRAALERQGLDGPVVLLDEVGMFLAGKDRRGLNADASFLQYLAQRAAGERCWLVCVTQRGLEEVGEVDRRTLRQMRDRFRAAFTLDLAELERVVERRLVLKRDPSAFGSAMAEMWEGFRAAGEVGFTAEELARSYPINPICLQALRQAAESQLSRTRSVVRLLQEAVSEGRWLERPAERLITADAALDLVREEMAYAPLGQRLLHACQVIAADAGRIAPGRERELERVVKGLALLGLGDLRWTAEELGASLVGGAPTVVGEVAELLGALYRWGLYVERARRADGWVVWFLDVGSDVSEQIRRRLNELRAELAAGDSRVAQAALEACHEAGFPLAGLMERRSLPVDWWNARRYVAAVCRDLCDVTAAELQNLAGWLASAETKEDGGLFVALPTVGARQQVEAWQTAGREVAGRFGAGLLAWLPRELSGEEQDQLVEHAALARMLGDPTLARRRDAELRARVRERWAESEAQVRSLLQRAYAEGRVVGADGDAVLEAERLAAMAGRWEEVLAAAFAAPFQRLFPKFPRVAPERRLAGRAQIHQVIDQFVRAGSVKLPPASTLEAHLSAQAAPLGLVAGAGGEFRLALNNRELVEAALAAAPARRHEDAVDPEDAIGFAVLLGRLAKSEWGLVREQGELLLAALIRTGHLVALDGFLQPVRLEAVAAPLGDHLPYVMRGLALGGEAGASAAALWQAGAGSGPARAWDLPTQERAWGEVIAWAARVLANGGARRSALRQAAQDFGHSAEGWAWAHEALAGAEALAAAVDASMTSREGLGKLAEAAARLPGGTQARAQDLSRWRQCELFLDRECAELAALHRLLSDPRIQMAQGSLLARQWREARGRFASSLELVAESAGVKSSARRWWESYRKHYLAWHERTHGEARFAALMELREGSVMQAARRLAAAGLMAEEARQLDAELRAAAGKRCLAGDPLPEGSVVCPACGVKLGEEVALPKAEDMAKRAEAVLAGQREQLREQEGMLRRRLAGCADGRVRNRVEAALGQMAGDEVPSLALRTGLPYDTLTDEVVAWLRQHLARPQAKRRELKDLAARLRGKEMMKQEVVKRVEEWLGGDEDDVIEVV
jgi:hypothetical protein